MNDVPSSPASAPADRPAGLRVEHVEWNDPRAVALREAMEAEMSERYSERESGLTPELEALDDALSVDPAAVRSRIIVLDEDGTPLAHAAQADAKAAALMPDLVKRDFTASRPGCKFVGDITYIHTWQGFVYLTTVIDCFSKKVVGWSIADHMRTDLVADAPRNAAQATVI